MSKLKHYGAHGFANEWFKSYLLNRNQHVLINHYDSNHYDSNLAVVKFVVLGGPVLDPLFLIYISDFKQSHKILQIPSFCQ